MPKTAPPGQVNLPTGHTFIAGAVPDPFDARDLEYRSRLEPLPTVLDNRDALAKKLVVLEQQGNSCTGHAVATVINTVLSRGFQAKIKRNPKAEPVRASPYMLYRLARRYDEFQGEADTGSSLRAAFKGWFRHGVLEDKDWAALNMPTEPDLEDPQIVDRCRERPLGAFYRVNPYRLDDMQSAISELHVIAVSASIHEGWQQPVALSKRGESLHVIQRPSGALTIGGHAFALVGYNEVGFLVQNSWGTTWGKGGYATLPYEEWLASAYDAWVARPGVPQTPFATGTRTTVRVTGGDIATRVGPDLERLTSHVVNLGNDGILSTAGKFVSTPAQVDKIFDKMDEQHRTWLTDDPASVAGGKRHVVLFAHGGLVSEDDGLETAQKQLQWWLNNRVYPISFAWQSGPVETLLYQLVDLTRGRLPAGGIGFDLVEQFDRLVEWIARNTLGWVWEQMKQNAIAASDPIRIPGWTGWPASNPPYTAMADQPGAALTIARLKRYVQKHGKDNVAVHLVGHSAGAIFLAAMLERLVDVEIWVETMNLMAPAIRVDEFERQVFPQIVAGGLVKHFATFGMSDARELDDVCGYGGVNPYHKSLLYLVARGFEKPRNGEPSEIPLVGLERCLTQTGLRGQIVGAGGACVSARSETPPNSRSDASSHGGFDDDEGTMTSVLLRMLGSQELDEWRTYRKHATIRPITATAQPIAAAAMAAAPRTTDVAPRDQARPLIEMLAKQGWGIKDASKIVQKGSGAKRAPKKV
jgi:pimeloyl-ACP methyl ester carboxylesterase